MVITVIISVKEDNEKPIASIVDNIIAAGYSIKKTELVYCVVSQKDYGIKRFDGPPIIRIRYYKDYMEGMNDCIQKALGDVMVLIDLDTNFPANKLISVAQTFEQNKDLFFFIGEGFLVIRNHSYQFPLDTFCMKTNLLMFSLTEKPGGGIYENGRGILGNWGKLHRKEVLRFSYKMDNVSWANKFKIMRSL